MPKPMAGVSTVFHEDPDSLPEIVSFVKAAPPSSAPPEMTHTGTWPSPWPDLTLALRRFSLDSNLRPAIEIGGARHPSHD
jgi:hypothetical protein